MQVKNKNNKLLGERISIWTATTHSLKCLVFNKNKYEICEETEKCDSYAGEKGDNRKCL